MPHERRWIILAADGRHSTLGRSAPPDEEEVARAASALAAAGHAGWLVRLDGDYWSRRKPVVLTMMQPLAHAVDAGWPAAVAAFEAMRMAAMSSKVRSSPSRMAGSPVKACQRSSATSQ
jgi:hypothetical protein